MKFYLIDDDKNIRNILKIIITERDFGSVCGSTGSPCDALEDVPALSPDIVIADLLMPEMDGISLVKKLCPILPDTAFIMLSQVSSKDMIASAYEAGIEYFIQKPLNSIEVESVVKKTCENLSMRRTMAKMQNIFLNNMNDRSQKHSLPANGAAPASPALHNILQRLGIVGVLGCKDIIDVVEYMNTHHASLDNFSLNDLCRRFSDSPKSMEQRIRRAATAGLVNLAHLGLEDYGNEIFTEYSSTLYNFEQVRREMDFIRGKSDKHGNVKIKNFLTTLSAYSQNP